MKLNGKTDWIEIKYTKQEQRLSRAQLPNSKRNSQMILNPQFSLLGHLYDSHIYLQLSWYDYIVQSLAIAQTEWFIKKHNQCI
jgi:hypothetical protein